MKRILLTLLLVLVSKNLQAQHADDPVSVVLDNTAYPFYVYSAIRTKDDWTRGGSSFVNKAGPASSSAQLGLGATIFSGDKTITFDWRLKQGSENNKMQFVVRDKLLNITEHIVQSVSTDHWCRVTVYLEPNTVQFTWFASYIPDTFWLDNVRIENGNNTAPTECGILGRADRKGPLISPAIISMVLNAPNPYEKSISGKVSLPQGLVAPAGGATITVETFPLYFFTERGLTRTTSDTVTILEGRTEVSYQIDLPRDGVELEDVYLEFECALGCGGLGITTQGSWSETLGVTSFKGADKYPVNQSSEIDVELEHADYFMGTISFNGPYLTNGNEQLIVTLVGDEVPSIDFFSVYIYPEEGASSVDFSVGAPTGTAPSAWTLAVDCNGCSMLSTENQYATTITGNPVTVDRNNAFRFTKGSDHSGMLLTIPAP